MCKSVREYAKQYEKIEAERGEREIKMIQHETKAWRWSERHTDARKEGKHKPWGYQW